MSAAWGHLIGSLSERPQMMHPNNSSIESFRTQMVGQRPRAYGTLEGPDTHLQIPGLARVLGPSGGHGKPRRAGFPGCSVSWRRRLSTWEGRVDNVLGRARCFLPAGNLGLILNFDFLFLRKVLFYCVL